MTRGWKRNKTIPNFLSPLRVRRTRDDEATKRALPIICAATITQTSVAVLEADFYYS